MTPLAVEKLVFPVIMFQYQERLIPSTGTEILLTLCHPGILPVLNGNVGGALTSAGTLKSSWLQEDIKTSRLCF